MYGFIKGKVDSIAKMSFIIDCGGIGYIINASNGLLGRLQVGQEIKVVTHTVVKEDDISLYGFVDDSEKSMFLKLVSVSGVGARSAIGILGAISYNDLALCIMTRNAAGLVKVKGIGKKTAERIILELRDKFDTELSDNVEYTTAIATGDTQSEAAQALIALGFKSNEANVMLKGLHATTTEELITLALRKRDQR